MKGSFLTPPNAVGASVRGRLWRQFQRRQRDEHRRTKRMRRRRNSRSRNAGEAELGREASDIVRGLGGQRSAAKKMILVAPWTGVIGGENSYLAVAVEHLGKIGGARHDIVVRVEWIGTKTEFGLQLSICLRHDLHKANRAFFRDGFGVAIAFGAHDGAYPIGRNVESSRRFLDGVCDDASWRSSGCRCAKPEHLGMRRRTRPWRKRERHSLLPGLRVYDPRHGHRAAGRRSRKRSSIVLPRPERRGAPNDAFDRKRAKIPSVEGRRFVPVEKKDLAGKENKAPTPNGQRSVGVITFARLRHDNPVDADGESVAANFLAGQVPATRLMSGAPLGR